MRAVAERLDVTPMALYKHLADRAALVDAMLDRVLADVARPAPTASWDDAVRSRVMATRAVLSSHAWTRPGDRDARARHASRSRAHGRTHGRHVRGWAVSRSRASRDARLEHPHVGLHPRRAAHTGAPRRSPGARRRDGRVRNDLPGDRPHGHDRAARPGRPATTTTRSSPSPSTCCSTASDVDTSSRGRRPKPVTNPAGNVEGMPHPPLVTLRARTAADVDALYRVAADLDTWEERTPSRPSPLTRRLSRSGSPTPRTARVRAASSS